MTTISSSRARRRRSPKTLLLLLLLVLIALPLLFWRGAAGGLFWRAAAPILAVRDAFGSSQNARLLAELASTTALVADRDALYQENLELKARLGRDASVKTTLASVIARPPAIPYDTLVIDAGTQDGVATGDLVSAGGTALIGEVSQAYAATARVELFSSPGRTYQALLRGSVPVDVSGQGGGSLTAQVPVGTPVAEGDAIIFPGIAGGLAGTVSRVEAKDGESFQTLYLRLPANPLELRYVEVWNHE